MGVLGNLIVNNIVDYTIRSTINAGKFFNVSATRKYFGDWSDSFTDFENYANEHFVAMDAVATTDTWMGVDADAAKTMLSDTETTLLNDILKLHDDIDSLHATILENFKLTVDSDPEAYISYDDLTKIESDFKEKSEAYNAQVKIVEDMILDLQEKYSKYGDIRTQDFSAGKTAFANFCGPDESLGSLAVEIAFSNFCSDDEPEGYLANCRQKLIQFDNETQILIEEANLDSRVDDLNKRMASFIVENHPEYLQLTNLNNVDKFVSGDNILLFDASFWSSVDVKLVRKIYSKVIKDNSNYAVNRPFFYGYMSHLNNIGSENWSDEDCESISMIMHLAIKNKDTELLNHALTEFTYTKAIDRRDNWRGYNVTYEIGVNKELMSKVLEHVDWKTQGKTYSTLSGISNMPAEFFETAYYKDGSLRPGKKEPYINLGSCIEDEKLKITITTNNNSYEFMSVNMYKKIGEEGYQNLKAIGMADEDICQFANSIFTKEDIQFVQGLSQATTEEEYYKVAQINPDKLSDAGKSAFLTYSSQVFDNAYDYTDNGVKTNSKGLQKIIDFSNGMFLMPNNEGHYEEGDMTGLIWVNDTRYYSETYLRLAYTNAEMWLDNSDIIFNECINLDDTNYKKNLNSFYEIQQLNYDYLTFLSGICECQSIEKLNNEFKSQDNYCESGEYYKNHLNYLTIKPTVSGRLDFHYSFTRYKKDQTCEKATIHAQEYCGEDIDDYKREKNYEKAVKNYQESIENLFLDAGLYVFSFIPVAPEMELAMNAGDIAGGIIGDINDIKGAARNVEEKEYELMTEWDQDGIYVVGTGGEEKLKTGYYNPETIYKWNLVKKKGLSVLCDDDSNNRVLNFIERADLELLSGDEWGGVTDEQKRQILACIWGGEQNSDINFDDITRQQFVDSIKFFQCELGALEIEYNDMAIGKTFSEKLSNWEECDEK